MMGAEDAAVQREMAADVDRMLALDERDRESVAFALANRTGEGFSGDLGYLSVEELAADAEVTCARTKGILAAMVQDGSAIERGGKYAGAPVDCVICGDKPCTCGVGTWR